MAFIKKRNARKELERDVPMPSVSLDLAVGGLRFNMDIGNIKVSLTHMERDEIVRRWTLLEKDFER